MATAMLALGSCSKDNNAEVSENIGTMDNKEALEVLKTRRSIRHYKDSLPDREILDRVLEAGTYAPTGMGKQSPVIVAVTDKATRDKLSEMNAAVMEWIRTHSTVLQWFCSTCRPQCSYISLRRQPCHGQSAQCRSCCGPGQLLDSPG